MQYIVYSLHTGTDATEQLAVPQFVFSPFGSRSYIKKRRKTIWAADKNGFSYELYVPYKAYLFFFLSSLLFFFVFWK